MAVFYKMRCLAGYSKINIDGSFISVEDLKAEIMQQERMGKSQDFTLQIINPDTKEVYEDDKFLINKNTSVWYARVPILVTKRGPKKWRAPGNDGASTSDDDGNAQSHKVQKKQFGEVPDNYMCYKCHQRGHWIKDCPLGPERAAIKRSSGIPASFMVPVKGPEVAGAMITASGTYAIPAMNQGMYIKKEIPVKGSELKKEVHGVTEKKLEVKPKMAEVQSKPEDLVDLTPVDDKKPETYAIPTINRGFGKPEGANKENCTYANPPPNFVAQNNYIPNYQGQYYPMDVQNQPPPMMYNQQQHHYSNGRSYAPVAWGNQGATNQGSSASSEIIRRNDYARYVKERRESQPSRKRNRSRSRSPSRSSSSSSRSREDYREYRPTKKNHRESRHRY